MVTTPDRSVTLLAVATTFAASFEDILAIDRTEKSLLQATGLDATKIICEVCLFFHLAHDSIVASAGLRFAVEQFIDAAIGRVLDAAILNHIARTPSGVHLVALILICARRYGRNSPHFAVLDRSIRSPAYLATERLPFRHQEAIWLAEQVTGEPRGRSCPDDFALLSRFSHPSVLKRDDLYSKTHAAMYETNFGRAAIHKVYGNEAVRLGIHHDLSFCFCNADWDLVGELCMTSAFLGGFQLQDAQCLEALDAVFGKFGLIPSITFDAAYATGLSERDRQLYEFVHSYHSTLVYGVLIASVGKAAPQAGDAEDPVQMEDVLAAIDAFFGAKEFEIGPLSQDWYAAEVGISLDTLIDGYATKCYRQFGRQAALRFIDVIPGATTLPLSADTARFFDLL